MGYVLEGSAAEYFHILNIQSPNLPYYDLLNRMEDFMEGSKSSSVLSPVSMYHYENLADSQIKHPASNSIFPCNHFPSNIVQGPQLNSPPVETHCQKHAPLNYPLVDPHCQKQRYIPYKGHQNSSNSTVGTQSIDTNFVPSNGSTVKSTESIADAFTGTSSADSTCIELDEEILGERLARLEKTFSRIVDLANSQFSVQLEPYPQVHATSSNDTQASSLHGPQVSSMYGPQASSLHDPPASSLHDSPQALLLHDPTSTDKNEEPRGKLRDQFIMLRGPNRLRSSNDCQEKHEAVRIKLELGSETIGLTSSPAKLELGSETIGLISSPAKHCGLRESREIEEVKESLRTVKDHEDWLDGVHDQQFRTSTPKEEPSKALQEYEDWFDHDETDSEENGSFWLPYSKKEQIKANELKSTEPAELHRLPGDDSSDASSGHQEIWKSKYMIDSANTEFWWDSMETKELRLRQKGEVEVPVLESLECYEDFIDNAYFERFGTLTPSVEASSTSREYEEWIDKKFEETFNTSAQEDLWKKR